MLRLAKEMRVELTNSRRYVVVYCYKCRGHRNMARLPCQCNLEPIFSYRKAECSSKLIKLKPEQPYQIVQPTLVHKYIVM